MRKIEYKKGDVINGLSVVKEVSPLLYNDKEGRKKSRRKFLFECYCGNKFESLLTNVSTNHTKSCGCYGLAKLIKRSTTHGEARKTYLYGLWARIKDRCSNKNRSNYKYYGGLGIKVHAPWINDYPSFRDWISRNLGDRPTENHSLDRINTDGNYEPDNLRWATQSTQGANQRKRTNNTSGYTGVWLNKTTGCWRASIRYNRKRKHLGYFESKHDAVIARNEYIKKKGFPHKIQKLIKDL